MTNYICINGKKAELTEEQMKALGIELPKAKSPFERCKKGKEYYYISYTGVVDCTHEVEYPSDVRCYSIANYCTDKDLLQQQAYRETLNRLLWRYSMEHDGDKIDWNDADELKYYIYYNHNYISFLVGYTAYAKSFERVYFHTAKIAENAIKEIVEPFMAEHPDFKW